MEPAAYGDYVSMRLPFGETRRAVREAFEHYGATRSLYNSDHDPNRPTVEAFQMFLDQTPSDEVLILLGGNGFTMENELLAFVVFTSQGWEYLLHQGYVYPKVLKRAKWQVIQYMVVTSG